MKKFVLSGVLSLTTFLFAGTVTATPMTAFSYTSSPIAWVGAGQTVTVTPLEGFDFSISNSQSGVSFFINDFSNNPDFWSTRWWSLDFAAPAGQPLQVGHYSDATRFPFNASTEPGLSFTGNGRGDNQLTGFFDILDLTFASDGSVQSFAANFTQYDEGFTESWNEGMIRYNSEIPLAADVPEPASLILVSTALLALVATKGKRRTQTLAV